MQGMDAKQRDLVCIQKETSTCVYVVNGTMHLLQHVVGDVTRLVSVRAMKKLSCQPRERELRACRMNAAQASSRLPIMPAAGALKQHSVRYVGMTSA